MKKYLLNLSLFILFPFLLACQPQNTADTPAPVTPTAVTVRLLPSPEVTPVSTNTPTATTAPTATPSPTPTNTPVPAERLSVATTALYNGNYATAATEFNALLTDSGASADNKRLALYWRGRSQLALQDYGAAEAGFALFLQTYPLTDTLAHPAAFQRGQALEHLNRYTDTITAYQTSLLPDDPIAGYITERMGDAAMQANRPADARNWYLTALNATSDSGFQVSLREKIAAGWLAEKNLDKALAQYNAILSVAQIPAYRAKITRLMGEAALQTDNLTATQTYLQQTLDAYPETYDAYLALATMIEAGMPVNDFQRGYVDYYGGSAYQPAADAMNRFLATNPLTNTDEALWISGWSWRAMGEYNKAITAFDKLIANHPTSIRWADANLQKARTLSWQGEITAAVTTYRDFAVQNPTTPQASEALWKAALIEFQDDQFPAAYTAFHAMAARYPASPYADDAKYWAGLAAYQQKTYPEALQEWADLLTAYPTSEFARAASYWQAKTMLQLKQTEQAQTQLEQLANQPLNYYSLRARDLLNGRNVAPTIPLNLSAPDPQAQTDAEVWLANWLGISHTADMSGLDRQIAGDPAFIRAERLWAFGLTDDALTEYEAVKDTWSDNPLAMYQLSLAFSHRRLYRLSILCAQQLVKLSPATDPATVPVFIRRLIYPIPYRDLVTAQTTALGLDPALVFALMRQESLFDPAATSSADARGLMQVIPPTGADIAQRTNTDPYTDQDLWLPYLNVQFGTWYLNQMLQYFGSNQIAALAAYNAGPGRVETWLAYTGANDLDVFESLIPLDEPRQYIKRIYLNLSAYREIYRQQ